VDGHSVSSACAKRGRQRIKHSADVIKVGDDMISSDNLLISAFMALLREFVLDSFTINPSNKSKYSAAIKGIKKQAKDGPHGAKTWPQPGVCG
jgi:hypothetical protein